MTKTIAIAGKGGTGKTTIAALLIKLLSQKGLVLAVDADPSTNLNQALGLPLDENRTVGRIREKMVEDVAKGRLSPLVTKQDHMFGKIIESLIESKGFDLIAMGRPEGPGCYCAHNEFLRAVLDRLVKDYKYNYIVMDCEAGMEHISRQTTRDIDVLLIISDPTMRGITTAVRIKALITELRSRIENVKLVINRVNGKVSPEMEKTIVDSGLELIMEINEDHYIADLDAKGIALTELPPDSALQQGVREIVSKLGL